MTPRPLQLSTNEWVSRLRPCTSAARPRWWPCPQLSARADVERTAGLAMTPSSGFLFTSLCDLTLLLPCPRALSASFKAECAFPWPHRAFLTVLLPTCCLCCFSSLEFCLLRNSCSSVGSVGVAVSSRLGGSLSPLLDGRCAWLSSPHGTGARGPCPALTPLAPPFHLQRKLRRRRPAPGASLCSLLPTLAPALTSYVHRHWLPPLFQGLADVFCKGPESEYFRFCIRMVSVAAFQFCHRSRKAAITNAYTNAACTHNFIHSQQAGSGLRAIVCWSLFYLESSQPQAIQLAGGFSSMVFAQMPLLNGTSPLTTLFEMTPSSI